jgi:hypothetical protein
MGSTSSELAAATAALISRLERVSVPLTRCGRCDPEARRLLRFGAQDLFPNARNPQAALAGLLLIAGCWDEAHQVSQDLNDAEGSYWHALAHRMEPETWNSDYWFGRVESHPIFAELLAKASEVIRQHPRARLELQSRWQPPLLNSWCDRARESQDPELVSAVTEIHSAECWLLWKWCARLSLK